jgi:DNA-binding MarR family transcriptional regulator
VKKLSVADFEDEALKVINLILRLWATIKKEATFGLSSLDLGIVEFVVLRLISEKRSSEAEIAKRLGITKAAMTYITDRLEQKKLVKRERRESDRRSFVLSLTQHGARTLKNAQRLYLLALKRRLKGMSEQEMGDLRILLEKLQQGLVLNYED